MTGVKSIKAYTVFMRVLLAVIAVMCLMLAVLFPIPGLIGAALSVFLFLKMPKIAKASFEAKWARETAARAAETGEHDEDEDDDEDDDEDAADNRAFDLNQRGDKAEKAGEVDKAIRYYEASICEPATIPFAYRRLIIIYKKQHKWDDVVRVCNVALDILPGTPGKWCEPEYYEMNKAAALKKLSSVSDSDTK